MNAVIETSVILVVAYLVTRYIRKHNWLQSKKLIFVGNQQYIFVYILLLIAIVGAIFFVGIHPNIFSISTLLLLVTAFILSLFKKPIIPMICSFLSLFTIWVGEFGLVNSVSFTWYISLTFLPALIVLLPFISTLDDNNLLKKSWFDAENSLLRAGASKTEIEKFKEYWNENQKDQK